MTWKSEGHEQIPVADWLSRLSTESVKKKPDEFTVCFNEIMSKMTVTHKDVAKETRRDPVLSKVIDYVQTGWPEYVEDYLKPFQSKQTELTVESGCLL